MCFFFSKVDNYVFYVPFYICSSFIIVLCVYVGFLTYSDPDGIYPTTATVQEASASKHTS
jgi:hypothetical protein